LEHDRKFDREMIMAEVVALKRQPEGPVVASREGAILTLTLSNPPANALSLETMQALQANLTLRRTRSGRASIVINAAGKLFCAGHDLKQMTAHRNDPDGGSAFSRRRSPSARA
jgi:enoyl-CoA hydratase/carnithine racemase